MDIYLIRHAESSGNLPGTFLGWADHLLSNIGQEQAQLLANRFAALGPMPVISSDLRRAYDTANIIANAWQGEVTTDCRWRETNCGLLEGQPWSALSENHSLSQQLAQDAIATVLPGGESVAMMMARVNSAFAEALQLATERLMIVTHGGPLHAVLADCLQIPPTRYWSLTFAHAGVCHLRYSQGWMNIITVNDCSHLAKFFRQD